MIKIVFIKMHMDIKTPQSFLVCVSKYSTLNVGAPPEMYFVCI